MSNIKNKISLPFKIVKSEVSGGFIDKVHNSFTGGIDIVNLHEDCVNNYLEGNLQSPFTNQWVGGKSHRHVPINDGNDRSENRPEAWHLEFQPGKISFYSHAYRNSPPAYWTREEYSKRPLNIKNIKSSDSLLVGNFAENYQVVQTSGRRIANNLTVDGFDLGGSLTTQFITGSNNYSLPELNKISGSRSVIVERFNAPGSKEESSRGALDREGEEMSPNIPLPYRNIKIRQPFYRQLAQHNPQFGSGSTYALLPETGSVDAVSIHKVNRNRLVRGNREQFDNGFVVHAIPRTDIQYSWITSSATTTAAELGGYQSFKNLNTSGSYYNRSHAYEDIEFIVGTHFGYFESYLLDENSLPILLDDGGFILLNNEFTNLTLDNLYINSLTKDYKTIDLDCRTFITTIGDIVPTYAEVTNSPYTFTTWTSIRGGQHPVTRQLRKNNLISTTGECENYVDPPVTFKYKPLHHNLRAFNQDNILYSIKHTYTNNLSSVANKTLINKLFLEQEDREQFYDELYTLYTEDEGPITDFVSYKYKEVIWPKEENTSLAKTRKRNAYYLNLSGSSRDGYDRQLGTQRAFWRDEQEDRRRSANSIGGYTGSIGYSSTLEEGTSFNQISVNYTSENPDLKYQIDEFSPQNEQDLGLHNSISCLEELDAEVTVFQYKVVIFSGSSVLTGKQINYMNREGYKFANSGEFNHNFISSYGMSRKKDQETPDDVGSFYSNTYYKTFLTSKDSGDKNLTIKTDNDEVILNPKLRYIAFAGGAELNTGSFIQSQTYKNTIVLRTISFFNSNLSSDDVHFSTLDFGLVRKTESDSNRKPFFDSYEDYIEDVRAIAKDYSTIPEFKISDHMGYYQDGNFRLTNQKIFIIDGQKEYQSAETETGEKNTQFYKSYLQSDLLKRHDKVRNENKNNSQIKSIKIKVSGIKKLLPYNGFYPQDRSVQLANLYADYVNENLAGGLYSIEKEEYGEQDSLFRHRGCHEEEPLEGAKSAPAPPEDCTFKFTFSIDNVNYEATINDDETISVEHLPVEDVGFRTN